MCVFNRWVYCLIIINAGAIAPVPANVPSPEFASRNEPIVLPGVNTETMNAFPDSDLDANQLDLVQSKELFNSELDAVTAASERFNPISIAEDREYMGAILQNKQYYFYTAGQGETGHDQVTVRVKIPAGSSIVAFWHTHGAAEDSRKYFSEIDTELALSWNKPFYLADYTGELKVFSPGDKMISLRKAKRLGLPAKKGFSKGRVVLDQKGRFIQVCTRMKKDELKRNDYSKNKKQQYSLQFAFS